MEHLDLRRVGGRTLICEWRWRIRYSSRLPQVVKIPVGRASHGNTPLEGDFDGDGLADIVLRHNGDFHVYSNVSNFTARSVFGWGEAQGDEAVLGDYDGDGKTDIAVRTIAPDSDQNRLIIRTAASGFVSGPDVNWPGGIRPLIVGDYTGDDRADVGIWDYEQGWVTRMGPLLPATSQQVMSWSATGVPVGGDYDGDGRLDKALWSNGTWLIRTSSSEYVDTLSYTLGTANDFPVSRARAPLPIASVACEPVTLSPTFIGIGDEGGTRTFTLSTTTPTCLYSTASDVAFVTTPSGLARQTDIDPTVTVSIAANGTGGPQFATLLVAGHVVHLVQGNQGCFDPSPEGSYAEIGSSEGTFEIDLVTSAGCGWIVPAGQEFLTLASPASGIGPYTVSYTYAANTGTQPRVTTMNVMGRSVTVTQYWSGADPFLAPAGCTYQTNPAAGALGPLTKDGQNLYIDVITTPNCPWTAASLNGNVATVSQNAIGWGTGGAVFQIFNNSSQYPRTGSIRAAGKTFAIEQRGTCDWAVALQSGTNPVSAEGATIYVNVDTGPECAWTAESYSDFIIVTEFATATGSHAARFEVYNNHTFTVRTGTVVVAGREFVITQLPRSGGASGASTEDVSYFYTDAIGSVRVVTNRFGTVTGRSDYLPFGVEWQPGNNIVSTLRFTGKERDIETAFGGWQAFDYFVARYYQSQTGRFSRPDDPGFGDPFDPQSMNLYAYTQNNPLRYVDPTGHCPEPLPAGYFCGGVAETDREAERATRAAEAWADSQRFFRDSWLNFKRQFVDPVRADQNLPPDLVNLNPRSVPRGQCFAGNYSFAWGTTNRFFFGGVGRFGRTAIGSMTAGAMARSTGLTTVGMAGRDLFRWQGVANLGVRGTLISIGANSLLNGVAGAAALEAGITIGAGIDATYQTFVANSCR